MIDFAQIKESMGRIQVCGSGSRSDEGTRSVTEAGDAEAVVRCSIAIR